jgi:hypothetical protein
MRPELIVFPAPLLNDYLGFFHSSEYLAVEQFVPQFTVE